MGDKEQMREYLKSAEKAGLHYVDDDAPGYERKKWGAGFTYLLPEGGHLEDEAERERIKALAIPPDWSEVWIAVDANAHIQATGRDSAGRKQYIYHEDWQEARQRAKFDHLIDFAHRLPDIRRRYDADMRSTKVSRERVLAVLTALLDRTMLRIGHEEYLTEHDSHGLATLFEEHVELTTTSVVFEFIGKGASEQSAVVRDRRLASQVRRVSDAPGERIFTYEEGGRVGTVTADDVNAYLEQVAEMECSAKDFRTWGATRTLVERLIETGPVPDEEVQQTLTDTIAETAEVLCHTPAVCREYYLHPDVLRVYEEGQFWPEFEAFEATPDSKKVSDEELSVPERFVLWIAARAQSVLD